MRLLKPSKEWQLLHDHIADNMRKDKSGFSMSNLSHLLTEADRKVVKEEVEAAVAHLMRVLLIDLQDPNSQDTPRRLAKMYVDEIFRGRYYPRPDVTSFPPVVTKGSVDQLLIEGPISVKSMCSHHWQPVEGSVWIGQVVGKHTRLIGLSKYARLADWVCRRPSLQEQATEMIVDEIENATNNHDVAVVMEARHMCMTHRGVQHDHAKTTTSVLRGGFRDPALRAEFLTLLSHKNRTP